MLRWLFFAFGFLPAGIHAVVAVYLSGSVSELDTQYLVVSAAVVAVAGLAIVWPRSIAAVPLLLAGIGLAFTLARALNKTGEAFVGVLLAGGPATLTILTTVILLPLLLLFRRYRSQKGMG